MSNRKQHHPEF